MKKKKIIFTSGLGAGGAERILNFLIQSYDRNCILIINITSKNSIYSKVLTDLGYQVVNLNFYNFLLLFRKISIFTRKSNVSYIGWMYYGCLISTLYFLFSRKNSKLIWNIRQSLYTLKNENIISVIVILLLSFLSAFPDFIIFNSKQGKIHHSKYFLFSNKFVVIPNGIKLNPVTNNIFFTNYNKNRILFVARFHAIKNYDTFFKVITELLHWNSNIVIDVYGDGWSQNNQLIDEYFSIYDNSLRSRININGNVLGIDEIYSKGGILLQTSISEGFSNVLIEAMYSGCLIIASDVGDTSDILVNKNFLINDCYDYKSYIAAVKSIFVMPEDEIYLLLEKQRISIIENYCHTKMITSFKKYI